MKVYCLRHHGAGIDRIDYANKGSSSPILVACLVPHFIRPPAAKSHSNLNYASNVTVVWEGKKGMNPECRRTFCQRERRKFVGIDNGFSGLIFFGDCRVCFAGFFIEGSLNSKLPTIWRVEKQMKSR